MWNITLKESAACTERHKSEKFDLCNSVWFSLPRCHWSHLTPENCAMKNIGLALWKKLGWRFEKHDLTNNGAALSRIGSPDPSFHLLQTTTLSRLRLTPTMTFDALNGKHSCKQQPTQLGRCMCEMVRRPCLKSWNRESLGVAGGLPVQSRMDPKGKDN